LRFIFNSESLLSSERDSWNTNIIKIRVISDIAHHSIAVARYHIDKLSESDQSAGPTRRAIPKTALLNQSIFDLSLLSVISAKIAFETDVFHPVIPSKSLARNITKIGNRRKPNTSVEGSKYDIPSTIQASKVPACVIARILFLPYLSESDHSTGAAINWKKLKVPRSTQSTYSGCE